MMAMVLVFGRASRAGRRTNMASGGAGPKRWSREAKKDKNEEF